MPIAGEKNGDDPRNSIPINSFTLRKVIEKAITILGWSAVEAIRDDLERHGIDLNSPSSRYTLGQLETALSQIFGGDATPLLMERIRRELKKGDHSRGGT